MRTTALLLSTALALVALAPQIAHAKELKQGDMVLSLGGGFSNNSYTLGAQFGYFVLPSLMPGVRYYYTHQKVDVGPLDYSVDQHEPTLFARYYILTEGTIFPFVTVDGGFLNYSQKGSAVQEKSFSLWSLFGGIGATVFFSRNFAAELTAGWRQYLSVPDELKAADFEERPFEWMLGFGFYL